MLVHVNIDPTSANYLVRHHGLRLLRLRGGAGELLQVDPGVQSVAVRPRWSGARTGRATTSVFMARSGRTTRSCPRNPPNEPGNCNPWVFEGEPYDKIYGRMFALRPTDATDLSKPWTFALGYDNPTKPGQGFVESPARHGAADLLGFVRRSGSTRRACAGPLRDPVRAARCTSTGLATELGTRFYWEVQHRAYRSGWTAAARHVRELHRALFGPPRLRPIRWSPIRRRASSRTRGVISLDQQAALGGWWTDFKGFRGANMSLLSRRLFANGGDESDCLTGRAISASPPRSRRWTPPSAIRSGCSSRRNEATTGQYFYGDPGVGGSVREPIADR